MIKGLIIAVIVIAVLALTLYHVLPVISAARRAIKGEGDDPGVGRPSEWREREQD